MFGFNKIMNIRNGGEIISWNILDLSMRTCFTEFCVKPNLDWQNISSENEFTKMLKGELSIC